MANIATRLTLIRADAAATFAGTNIGTLFLFTIRNFKPDSGDTIFLDELRLASTFEDALVPEPSSLALLGLAGLIVVRRRRS